MQNNALRVTLNLHSRSHVTTHYRQLHWLNIDQRTYFKLLVMVFKCINCHPPSELAGRIVISCPSDMLLVTGFVPSSQMGRKAFRYLGPRCWNAMPKSLRIIPNFPKFKGKLKNYLFNNFLEFLHNVDPYTTPVIGFATA